MGIVHRERLVLPPSNCQKSLNTFGDVLSDYYIKTLCPSHTPREFGIGLHLSSEATEFVEKLVLRDVEKGEIRIWEI